MGDDYDESDVVAWFGEVGGDMVFRVVMVE